MELKDLQSVVLQNKNDLSTLQGEVKGMDHRLQVVEKTTDILIDIQKTLVELTVESRNNGEKMNDLKLMMKDSNADNKKQHEDICARVSVLEEKPGKKWENAVWLIVSGVIMAVVGFALAQLKVLGG